MFTSLFLYTHVPTYTHSNCVTPPHHHSISQVIYLKGSGGLEFHIINETKPFNILENEILDVDAVFRDEVDPTTFQLYIGCGGCDLNEDDIRELTIPPLQLAYQKGVIEPFTQTYYRSGLRKEKRKYNSSHLRNCDHFTIRLHDFQNRTDGSEIIWAPVIGLAESFTFAELLAFPIYILRNHGYAWNDLAFTYWMLLFWGGPAIFLTFNLFQDTFESREVLYIVGFIGFITAFLEELIHLIYAQTKVEIHTELGIGLSVISLSQLTGLFLIAWFYRHYNTINVKRIGFLQIIIGFLLFVFFGSGFYIGPSALLFAGLLQLLNNRKSD